MGEANFLESGGKYMVNEIKSKLKQALPHRRFNHSVNVMKCAAELAFRYNEDRDKAILSGLLHDCARGIKTSEAFKLCKKYNIEVDSITSVQPVLLHGPLGACIAAEEYGVNDESILRAIRFHTTGYENMDMLTKIIIIADYIEPGRNFPGVDEIRKIAFEDIEEALVKALDSTIKYIIAKEALIHPDTVRTRNFIVYQKNGGEPK
jgi:predicted HD superfamily hydrolase involved in NAD metabolism